MTEQNKTLNQSLPNIKQLRQAVPAHCFQRSTLKSMLFAFRDSALMFIVGYLAHSYIPYELSILSILLWVLYAIVQGTIGMGIWVLGHECGHEAFSSHKMVNEIMGYILHSFLLVPFFSWQRSHQVHHAKCNHLIDGEAHVPSPKKEIGPEYDVIFKILGEKGFVIFQLINHSAIGWLVYLIFHGTGSKRSPVTKQSYTRQPNHFNFLQTNELYPKQWRFRVFLSTVGVFSMLGFLLYLGTLYGYMKVALLYFGPYNVVFYWVVIMTWLQHTDTDIPHYGQDQWSWLRGALTTVDRPYPWIADELHHHLGTTHVCHHIFHTIPHYHAEEASKAIIPILKGFYRYDPTPIHQALVRIASECHYVDDNTGVQYPKSYLKDKRNENK